MRKRADSIVAQDSGGPADPFCSTHRALNPGGGAVPEGTPFTDSSNLRSPTFLAPGIGFVEDNLSTDWVGLGMISG